MKTMKSMDNIKLKQDEHTKRYNEYIKNLPEIPKTVTDYISKLMIYSTDNGISNTIHILDTTRHKYIKFDTRKVNEYSISHLNSKYLLHASGTHNAVNITIMYQTTNDTPFVYYVTIKPKLTTVEKIKKLREYHTNLKGLNYGNHNSNKYR